MKRIGVLLEEFSGMGDRHYFCLRSGQECEGWIVSVEEETFHFLDCGQEQDADAAKLRIGAVDMETLAFHDPVREGWMTARWDAPNTRWIQSPLPRPESVDTDKAPPAASNPLRPALRRLFGS